VIVADFFHWAALGEWKFDEAEWPDPQQMVDELASMGTRLMVSVWPSVNPVSSNWADLRERGLLIGTEFGLEANTTWTDKPSDAPVPVAFYDATHPEAREFIWDAVSRNYGRYGIDVFWLDACEPEVVPLQHANLRFWAGRGTEVANLYPREHARAFWEGRVRAGQADGLSFARSAWAGSQRYGAALWSGDIGTDFATLRRQIAAGLSTGISGIPWWCADIGGFHGGDPRDPAYQEVMIRWFQFGALSPIFRMHGDRVPRTPLGRGITGGPNEVWSYGAEAEAIMVAYLHLRERLRPYIQRQMTTAAESGLPPMRALFLESRTMSTPGRSRTSTYSVRTCWSHRSSIRPPPSGRSTCPPGRPGPMPGPGRHTRVAARSPWPLRWSASRCCCEMRLACRSPHRLRTGREPRREQRSATRARQGFSGGYPSYDRYASPLLRSIAVRTRKGTRRWYRTASGSWGPASLAPRAPAVAAPSRQAARHGREDR
jgi:hypothetical protein